MKNKKLPVSACIIVKNEEENILKCIESLITVVSEIIVVDTGSEDQTLDLIRQKNLKVYSYEWNDNFSDARNFSIKLATKPYVFIIDADEVVDHTTISEMNRYISEEQTIPGTVIVQSEVSNGKTVSSSVTRLFPNKVDFSYKGNIHEQLWFKNKPVSTLCSTNLVLRHYGYNKNQLVSKNKFHRNLFLLKKELELNGESPYINFQIGQSYYVNEEYHEAIVYFDNAIKSIPNFADAPKYVSTIFLSYGYCLMKTTQFDRLDHLINEATEYYRDFTDLYFLYGSSLIERKDETKFINVKEVFEFCLYLGEPSKILYETVDGVGTFLSLFNLGVYYEVMNNFDLAIKFYKKSSDYGFEPAIQKVKQFNLFVD
ncbi:glycosyltransferase family 2 protein [Paenibacillus illinoisensis]|uniref:glycosyltransferase family 2 protein n=1 Tax=Paenibacillus illinoisensis TaxID=59845 RepID=UPI002041AB0F|nr:glycosyltransferase family 2 protein [Paenibacillus illinoisensis]MCM3208586.1 glycosyltransferase family 2 protein [Paenibacillus illinoisensis]